MDILSRLSSQLGDRDNAADIALAEELVKTRDKRAIRELVEHLEDRNKRLQGDCLKTPYEIGEWEPSLIAPYVDEFAAQLASKNPRMLWGAMCALDAAASADVEAVYLHLKSILEAAEGESVIARDHAVNILAKLYRAGHAKKCFPKLFEIIRTAPINQLPSYAEKAGEVVVAGDRKALASLITKRLAEVSQPAKRKRLEKVLRKLEVE